MKKGVERSGKVITLSGISAQIDKNGAAVAVSGEENFVLDQEGLESLLGNGIDFKVVDEFGFERSDEPLIIERTGLRGKAFKFTERLKIYPEFQGKPVVVTTYGTPVAIDQFGHPYHTDALNEKQYYSIDGDIVTLTEDQKVARKLPNDLRIPIFLIKGDARVNFRYHSDRYVVADMEGKHLLYDQSAYVIDGPRVMKFDRMVKGVINKHFPLKQCIEGSYFYEDLINRGREVVTKALISIDHDKAINTVSSSSKRKKVTDEERLRYKAENPEEAFIKCEENWVQQALFNEFRRLAWRNSEKFKEGRAVSISAAACRNAVRVDESGAKIDLASMLDECEEGFLDAASNNMNSIEVLEEQSLEDMIGSSDEDAFVLNINQANSDLDFLLELVDTLEGKSSHEMDRLIQEALLTLSDDRREDLQALLKSRRFSVDAKAKSDEEIAEEYESALQNSNTDEDGDDEEVTDEE